MANYGTPPVTSIPSYSYGGTEPQPSPYVQSESQPYLMRQMRILGSQQFIDFLKQMRDLQTGKIQPWQMPQYKGMASYFNTELQKMMKQLYADAEARGISGGSLGELMRGTQEQGIQGLLGSMQKMYQQAWGQIPESGRAGMGDFENWAKRILEYKMHKDRMQAEKMSQISQSIMSFIG